ncbi:MAG: hypothetical protein OEZ38_02125 [Gammaproteobacteria bacterium]|nr:hypothetical protein [Gammaproteobacteria bacterium]
MRSPVDELIKKHVKLTHTDMMKVVSHVQREIDDWIINTLMIEGCDVPFKYKRKKIYRDIKGQMVNMTYYPAKENVAGMEIEVMNVVRIRMS